MLSELREYQPRFNGHLATYLERVRRIANRELNEFDRRKAEGNLEVDIEQLREQIVEDLFASFYREPS